MSTRTPRVLTCRELVKPAPGPGKAQWMHVAYAEPRGLTRAAIQFTSGESDAYHEWYHCLSSDNGRTWNVPRPIPDVVRDTPAGGIVDYPAHPCFDPASGQSYRFFMRRQWPGLKPYTYDWSTGRHPLVDHVFVSENEEPARLLRYEPGDEYRPDNPFHPGYLQANNAYLGNAPAFARDGAVYFPVCCARPGQQIGQRGVVLFRRDPAGGQWLASNRVEIPVEWSSRGLLEPEAAVLRDGRVLVVCRGSNTATTPGRKWCCLSDDGGATLSPVRELTYQDGGAFFSPSSIHRFVRSARNGRLYWIANLVAAPPRGNEPRYPLQIAEIDEDTVAVRRDSVTVIDDRQAGEPAGLQLSNFSVLEDRATGRIEVYMTLLGLNAADFWRSDVVRYVVELPE